MRDTRDPKGRRECLDRAASLDHEGSQGLLDQQALWGHPDRLEPLD